MQPVTRWIVALAMLATTSAALCIDLEEPEDANAGTLTRAQTAARAKDPGWKPSTSEVGLIKVGEGKVSLKNFCLDADGNILACVGPSAARPGSTSSAAIRVYSPMGERLRSIPLEFNASAICIAKDGSIFVAGDGRIAKIDSTGKMLASAVSPVAGEQVVITKEVEDILRQTRRNTPAQREEMKRSLEQRRVEVTGVATTEQDVFMVVPTPNEFTYRVYRFDLALQNPTVVVEKLRGCCGQMDIQAANGKLWVAHNARHDVESFDRDGKPLAKFGTSGKVKASDFGGCCEPKNVRVMPNGDILAAESGPPTCIKRFSADGKFLGVIAVLNTKGECVRVTVAASPDGSRYYMMDTQKDAIHIFGSKG